MENWIVTWIKGFLTIEEKHYLTFCFKSLYFGNINIGIKGVKGFDGDSKKHITHVGLPRATILDAHVNANDTTLLAQAA